MSIWRFWASCTADSQAYGAPPACAGLPTCVGVAILPICSTHCGHKELWWACWHLPLLWTLSFLGSRCTLPVFGESVASAYPRVLTLVVPWGGAGRFDLPSVPLGRQPLLGRQHTKWMWQRSQRKSGWFCCPFPKPPRLLCRHRTFSVAFYVPGNAEGPEQSVSLLLCPPLALSDLLLPSHEEGCLLGVV